MNTFYSSILAIFGVVSLGLSDVAHSFPLSYSITDLGTLGGTTARPADINNLGQIVGASRTSDGEDHAFLYHNGIMQDLGTPGVVSSASAINDSGLIVGGVENAGIWVAGVWNSGVLTVIPGATYANDVNSLGQVLVATGSDGFGPTSAIYSKGVLGPSLGIPYAYAINDHGTVVGTYWPGRRPQVVTVTNGVRFDPNLRGSGVGINNSGRIIGTLSILLQNPAFSYKDGVLSILDDLSPDHLSAPTATGVAINNLDQIVGSGLPASYNTGTHLAHSHAFLWEGGTPRDLNDHIPEGSGWDLLHASGINDLGQIVGVGEFEGASRAFLLTPEPVPEPSSVALLVVCAFATFGTSRRALG